MSDRRRTLRWLSLLFYTGLVLFVGFLHTETTPREAKDCPACNFQKSAGGVSPTPAYVPATLFLTETLQPDEPIAVLPRVVPNFVARAPPLG